MARIIPISRPGLTLFSGVFVGWIAVGALADGPGPPARQAAVGALPDLVHIPPGTRVEEGPPSGWSDLVAKSVPRLASGDLGTLPDSARATATLFRTAILADVERPGRARGAVLRRVGIGNCLPVRGHDTVVTPASLKSLGVSLGTLDRLVLDRAEAELAKGRLVARSPTFALFSTPATLVVDGAHRAALLRYALLVDPKTGALRVGVWAISADPRDPWPVREWVQLSGSLVFDCRLDVAASRILGAIPVSWSFAMDGLPPGQARPWPPSLRGWAERDPKTPADVARLEQALRAAWEQEVRSASRAGRQ
jgi:hypothetical protein